jgi:hypothetical protein
MVRRILQPFIVNEWHFISPVPLLGDFIVFLTAIVRVEPFPTPLVLLLLLN